MPQQPSRVLDVGNCNPDHGMIRSMLEGAFYVKLDRVMFVDDAMQRVAVKDYDLVMVNRLIFDDGSDGGELIRRMQADDRARSMPVMMISNYDEAQQRAMAEGAVRGFGKASVGDKATIDLLSAYLSRK